MIPLVAPCITGHDRGYMRQRIADGLLADESEVARFEVAFAERVGCAGAVAVCSGTQALSIVLDVLGITRVSVPSYSCEAFRWVGDLDLVDSVFDVSIAQATQDDADVVVHMFGRPTIGSESVVEDWTLSLGGVAALDGEVGVCSTHASKMISTGRGGVVFSNDANLLEEIRRQVESGTGYGVAMSSMQAALGVSQLEQLDEFIERRREIADFYSERFEAADIKCPSRFCGSVFFRYIISVANPAQAVEELAAVGVEAGRGVYPSLHHFGDLDYLVDEFPGANENEDNLLSVPCHPSLTNDEIDSIVWRVMKVCAR